MMRVSRLPRGTPYAAHHRPDRRVLRARPARPRPCAAQAGWAQVPSLGWNLGVDDLDTVLGAGLPARFHDEPVASGRHAGAVISREDFARARAALYAELGWH